MKTKQIITQFEKDYDAIVAEDGMIIIFFVGLCRETAQTRNCKRPEAFESVLKEAYNQYKAVVKHFEWNELSLEVFIEKCLFYLQTWGWPSYFNKDKPKEEPDWEFSYARKDAVQVVMDYLKITNGNVSTAKLMWGVNCHEATNSEKGKLMVRGKMKALFQEPEKDKIFTEAVEAYNKKKGK